jgi:hypothetical protein
MLKYLNNNKDCNNKDAKKFDLLKCNKSLYKKVSNNSKLLLYRRCIFMTFDEYSTEKVHINNNMCCRVFESVNETALKSTIQAELENIRGNLLRPSYLKIPLPIYVMLAKKLETINKEDVFNGNYTAVLYIPNLFNYNGDGSEYTLFPSLDAFSKQNRWMELMTSQFSKYLDIIQIGSIKDNNDKIKKKNYLKTDLTATCYNLGCVANEKETFLIPEYSTTEATLLISAENLSPYYPKKCLKTPYYNKHMMDFKPADEKRFRGSADVFSDTFDVNLHCSPENMKKYESESKKDEETFDVFLCKQITKCKKYTEPVLKYDNDYDSIICDNNDRGKVEILMSDFYRKNIKPGTDKENYSEDYNNNILKELAYRKSRYPGPGKIQEVIFSMFQLNEALFNEDLFCYMPWRNILLKQDYVINEGETLEIDRVSLKSFNNMFEMKIGSDGYLNIYKGGQFHSRVPNQKGVFKCYTKRVVKFESLTLNISGYDEHENYDQRGYVSLSLQSMYGTPASLILANNGFLMLYDLGVNRRM